MPAPVPDKARYAFGPFVYDAAEQQLRREDRVIALTPKAADVLALLLRRPGELVTKSELLDAVWADTAVGDGVLKVAIAYLRKALGDQPSKPRYIETAHRRGYRFVAGVSRVRDGAEGGSRGRRRLTASASDQWLPEGPMVSDLVARASELETVLRAYARACSGSRAALFVEGAAGVGKTSLVEAFCSQLPDTVRVARGHCLPQYAAGEPYFPVLSALGKLAGANAADEVNPEVIELLRKHAPTWLAQMPPLLDHVDRRAVLGQIAGANQQRMLREMAEALEAYTSEAPLVLVLEDLHWADRPTLDLLSAVARRTAPARLMVLATYRPREAGAPAPPILALAQELTRFAGCEILPLSSFDAAGVRAFLERRFPGLELPEGLIERTWERTGGNALFLANVAEDWFAHRWIERDGDRWMVRVDVERLSRLVPESLRLMIDKQIGAYGGPEQQVLETAAVAGAEFGAQLVADVLGESCDAVEKVCETLAGRGQFLRTRGVEELPDGRVSGTYEFVHSLYRDVCRERIAAPERVRTHRRVAAWLEATYGARRPELAAQIAEQFEAGRQPEKAIEYRRRAAQEAVRRVAYREGIELLGRALSLCESVPEATRDTLAFAVAEERATMHIKSGDYLTGVAQLQELIEEARARKAPRAEASALVALASIMITFDFRQATALLDKAARLAQQAGDELLASDARGRVAYFRFCHAIDRGEETVAALREGLGSAAAELDRKRIVHRMACLPLVLSTMGRHAEAQQAFDEACDSFLEHKEVNEYLIAVLNATAGFMTRGALRKATAMMEEARATSERNGDPLPIGAVRALFAYLSLLIGDFEGTLALEEEIGQLTAGVEIIPLKVALTVLAGQALNGLGRHAEALGRLEEVVVGPSGEPDAWCAPIITFMRHQGLAEAHLGLGNLDAARENAQRMIELSRAVDNHYARALGHLLLARAARAEHRLERALEELVAAEPLCTDGSIPLAEWQLLAERAAVERELGDAEAADRSLYASRSVVTGIASELSDVPDARRAFLAWSRVRWVMES